MKEKLSEENELGTRAVMLPVEGGSNFQDCNHCDERIKFMSPASQKASIHLAGVIICNVYENGKWDRIEQFHPDCYKEAGGPFGEIKDRPRASMLTED